MPGDVEPFLSIHHDRDSGCHTGSKVAAQPGTADPEAGISRRRVGREEVEWRSMRPPSRTCFRERAVKRLKKRRDFFGHLLVYLLVNAFLVVIWALGDSDGFFWPVFPIVGWGIAVVMNAWDVYRNDEFDEDQIRREMGRLQGQE